MIPTDVQTTDRLGDAIADLAADLGPDWVLSSRIDNLDPEDDDQ